MVICPGCGGCGVFPNNGWPIICGCCGGRGLVPAPPQQQLKPVQFVPSPPPLTPQRTGKGGGRKGGGISAAEEQRKEAAEQARQVEAARLQAIREQGIWEAKQRAEVARQKAREVRIGELNSLGISDMAHGSRALETVCDALNNWKTFDIESFRKLSKKHHEYMTTYQGTPTENFPHFLRTLTPREKQKWHELMEYNKDTLEYSPFLAAVRGLFYLVRASGHGVKAYNNVLLFLLSSRSSRWERYKNRKAGFDVRVRTVTDVRWFNTDNPAERMQGKDVDYAYYIKDTLTFPHKVALQIRWYKPFVFVPGLWMEDFATHLRQIAWERHQCPNVSQ